MNRMRRFLQFVGTVVFFCAWPAFWIYFKRGYGRTRVIMVHEGKVLVMKQWISAGKWSFPGGGLHRGEDRADGAAREVKEETSLQLDARQLQQVGTGAFRSYGLSFDFYVFVTGVGSTNVRAQRIEVSELTWVYPEELTSDNAGPDTLLALQIARDTGSLLQYKQQAL
jgi:8-oxo-dGTP pyrophosphatase MutT (NUDIX family)